MKSSYIVGFHLTSLFWGSTDYWILLIGLLRGSIFIAFDLVYSVIALLAVTSAEEVVFVSVGQFVSRISE